VVEVEVQVLPVATRVILVLEILDQTATLEEKVAMD
jgi:hypothetical protein